MKGFNLWALKVKRLNGVFSWNFVNWHGGQPFWTTIIVNTFEWRNLNFFMFIVYFLHEEKTIRVKVIEKNWKISVREFLLFAVPFFKHLICIFWRPTHLTHDWYAPYSSLTRACAPYPPLLSPIRPLCAFSLLCCAVLIVRYGLRLKKTLEKLQVHPCKSY